jgi:hypothetical protein
MIKPLLFRKLSLLRAVVFLIVIALSFLAGTLSPVAWTQSKATVPLQYIQVDYMKVPEGNLQKYLEIEQLWRPVHEELIRTGNKKAWALYGLPFAGANDEYNYLTLNIFEEFEQMENQYPPEIFERVHPGRNYEEINERTLDARTQVRSDVWILVDQTGLTIE